MSHIIGKVYEVTQGNFQRVILELEETQDKLAAAEEALTAVQLSHAELEEALEFYAEPTTYEYSIEEGPEDGTLFISGPVTKDNGARARAALRGSK